MSVEQLRVGLNSAFTIPESGMRVSVRKIEKQRAIPGSVAMHESLHAVAAKKIKWASIIPSGNALGITVPEEMTAAAAAAPAAFGHKGVGHDLSVVEYGLGVNVESAKAAGRAAISGNEKLVDRVASRLEEDKTIGQREVDEEVEGVQKEEAGIFPTVVSIKSPHGELRTHETESYRQQVLVPGEWLYLENANRQAVEEAERIIFESPNEFKGIEQEKRHQRYMEDFEGEPKFRNAIVLDVKKETTDQDQEKREAVETANQIVFDHQHAKAA